MSQIKIKLIKRLFASFAFGVFASAPAFANIGKVLVVLSGVGYVSVRNAPAHPTGFFLVELAGPLMAIRNAGFDVVFANPNGSEPVMDKVSDDPKWFKDEAEYQKAKALIAGESALKTPRLLSSFSTRELRTFDAIFLPGGHAPMEDLYKDADLGRMLRYFHAAQKTTALICHAPIALLSAKSGENWIYSGYKMTVFSDAEEKHEEDAGVFGGHLNYYVQDALTTAGGNVQVAAPWTSHAVRDHELITGQNPMSEGAFTRLLMDALVEQIVRKQKPAPWSPASSVRLPGNTLVNVGPSDADWAQGYTTLYLGKKQDQVTAAAFLSRIQAHIAEVQENFHPLGLNGYVVYVGRDFEVAYQNWASKEAATLAFATPGAQEIFRDAGTLLDNAWFDEMPQIPASLTNFASHITAADTRVKPNFVE